MDIFALSRHFTIIEFVGLAQCFKKAKTD